MRAGGSTGRRSIGTQARNDRSGPAALRYNRAHVTRTVGLALHSPLNAMTSDSNGCWLGYDPGGDGKHGVAAIRVEDGVVTEIELETAEAAHDVVTWFSCRSRAARLGRALGIGVDTLAYWSGGPSGWRHADRFLQCRYPDVLPGQVKTKDKKPKTVADSVASANGLRGSMGLNGMFVLLRLRNKSGDLYVTETHPKVLHWALVKEPYAAFPGRRPKQREKIQKWEDARTDWQQMNPRLAVLLSLDRKRRDDFRQTPEDAAYENARMPTLSGVPGNDHEWDALISAWAAYRGHESKQGRAGWKNLVDCETRSGLEFPAGLVEYRWPDEKEIDVVQPGPRTVGDNECVDPQR